MGPLLSKWQRCRGTPAYAHSSTKCRKYLILGLLSRRFSTEGTPGPGRPGAQTHFYHRVPQVQPAPAQGMVSVTNSLRAEAINPFFFFFFFFRKRWKSIGIMQLKSCLLFPNQTLTHSLGTSGPLPNTLNTGENTGIHYCYTESFID